MINEAAFSRFTHSGKRSSKIEARVHDETKMDLTRKCHELGITESDYITCLVEVSLYGADKVLQSQERHVNDILGMTGRSGRSDS